MNKASSTQPWPCETEARVQPTVQPLGRYTAAALDSGNKQVCSEVHRVEHPDPQAE